MKLLECKLKVSFSIRQETYALTRNIPAQQKLIRESNKMLLMIKRILCCNQVLNYFKSRGKDSICSKMKRFSSN